MSTSKHMDYPEDSCKEVLFADNNKQIADMNNGENLENRNKEIPYRLKILKTVMLAVPFVCMGMTHSIQYTTIPDMRNRLKATTQQISYAMSAGVAGGLFGGPSALFIDRFYCYSDMIIAVTVLSVGISFGLFPYSGFIWVLGILDFIFSFSWGLYQAAAHSVISHMWGADGGPARFAIHFGYPLGSVIGPLVAVPFVTNLPEDDQTGYMDTNTTTLASTSTTLRFQEDTSSIEYAYLICTAILTAAALVFFAFQGLFRQTYKSALDTNSEKATSKSFREVLSADNWADGDLQYGIVILIFATIYYILQVGTMKGTQEYLVTYAVDSRLFTHRTAALLNSAVFFAGTFARGCVIVIGKYVRAPYILFAVVQGQFLFGLLCLIFGTRSSTALWILAPGLGFFRELGWPSGYVWIDYYVVLLGIIVGIIDVGLTFCNMGLTPLQGYFFDNFGIDSIFYTTVLFGYLQCVVVVAMTAYASKRGGRKYRSVEKNEPIEKSVEISKL